MKRTWVLLLAVVLLVLGWWVWRGDPDLRAIRRNFTELTEAAQWTEREDALRAGLAARRIVQHCLREIAMQVKDLPFSLRGREEVQAAILHARTSIPGLAIAVTDSEIELAPDRESAEMYVTARVDVQYTRERLSDLRSVKLTWQKTDDGWMLARVESFETIE